MSVDLGLSNEKPKLDQFPEPGVSFPAPSDSGWWFTVAAYAMAILTVMLAPDLGGTPLRRTLGAVSLMAGSFAIVWMIRWIIARCHRLRTRWIKGRRYDGVYEVAARHQRELEASQGLIRRLLSSVPSYTGISVSVFGGRLLLEIPKKGNRVLPVPGRILSLLDLESGSIIGTFEITQAEGRLCQARDCGDLDPIFRGYALNANARFLPENMALLALPEKDGADE